MGPMRYFTPLLLATVVLADYYIDNANTSVIYSMPPTQGGQGWQTFSAGSPQLALSITNSTGNYTIVLDPSHCYNQDYALGVCTTEEGCFVQMPFVGSGITMYVFNAGASGMTASFSIDGGTAISNSIDAPPGPTFQVSNVTLYDIQGLPTGNHTMKMTLLDWNGGGTSMKFDYARVNETFVALPVSTSTSASQTSSQTPTPTPTPTSINNSATAKKVNVGAIVGATLGGLALLAGLAVGIFYLRKRKATTHKDDLNPDPTFHVNPFTSEVNNLILPPAHHGLPSQYQERTDAAMRSAILRDALAGGNYSSPLTDQSSQSISSGNRSAAFQPLRRQPSYDADVDAHVRSSASRVTNASPVLSDQRYNLTPEQVEIIDRLRADNVPQDTVMRVFEGFVSPKLSVGETSDRRSTRARSFASAAPPPSYQTRDG